MKILRFAAGLWALSAAVQADAPDSSTSGLSAPVAVPAERAWRFGVALGYGVRSNPLIQSDDIPVIVDLDVAWFGKRWFFDNGDIGFSLVDGPRFTTSVVARLNSDRVFFGKTNTRYVNFSYQANGQQSPITVPPGGTGGGGGVVVEPVAVKPPDRDYAVELGFESLLDGDWGAAALRAFHDVSSTHEGFEISADYQYRITRGRLSVAPRVAVAYKSQKLNDYYWGVRPEEAGPALSPYQADAGFGWEGGVRFTYYLTRSVRLAVSANYERLAPTVADSPLAEEDHVFGYFSGIAWTF